MVLYVQSNEQGKIKPNDLFDVDRGPRGCLICPTWSIHHLTDQRKGRKNPFNGCRF